MIIYFLEDTLHLIYKNKLISKVLKNTISKGFIVNKELFMQEFTIMLKNAKVKNKLFGDNITIVNSGYFKTSDLFFLESIFTEMGFIKVDFMDIRDLFSDDNVTYIEINNNYMILYLDESIYLDLNFFKDIPKILEYFKSLFANNIYLFGINKNIPNIHMTSISVYYIENYNDYITSSLLKVKKYGV